ncbi:MAG TPA: carboxypeptidase-like regulatory domain-containing protein [Ferruginibacter sp.]|nr:carboxypeptidase-like regulatory domain-containing protein [Ferruginibacter sp.]
MKKFSIYLLFSFLCVTGFSQSYYTISGKIISSDSKQPLQGASVFAQNTTIGTATDAEGNFKLTLPDGGYSLVITFT